MIAVDIQKLLVRFGATVALDRIDLRVAPGELFLLLGPSGCGKTTLLRSLAGFVKADEGRIFFDSDEVTHLSPGERQTGMVFQSFALWPHLSVAENVGFGLRERRVARRELDERVQRALESVNMEGRAESPIDQLSGGEQQRIALARALVVRPRCLLLDEPLSNLDAHLRQSMREEIRRVVKSFGLTAVYVTHDQKEALAIADRIAVMQKGRVLQIGTPSDIYQRPASRTVAAFIGETNLLEGDVVRQEGKAIRVSTKIGELVAQPGSLSANVGEKVWVSIRPECWTLALDLDAASHEAHRINTITGVSRGTTYLGELAEHRLDVGEIGLRVYEFNPQGERHQDRPVTISVAPRDVIILPLER
jgi:iron(III) transport system ATP-binding protein